MLIVRSSPRLVALAALLLALVLASGCAVPGQRLITFQIEQDGAVVLEGMYGVPDSTKVPLMWAELPKVSFAATKDESLPTDLKGQIVVRILHVDRVLSSSTVPGIVIKADASGSNYQIEAAEAERIRTSAVYP